jgi:hypothetical protein
MKKILFVLLLATVSTFGQYDINWYGSEKPEGVNLAIPVGDSTTSEYWTTGDIMILQVDSNWTSSNIGFEIYNPKEETWELLQYYDGETVEYNITVGKGTLCIPKDIVGFRNFRFAKISSGSYVTQTTNPSSVVVHSTKIK